MPIWRPFTAPFPWVHLSISTDVKHTPLLVSAAVPVAFACVVFVLLPAAESVRHLPSEAQSLEQAYHEESYMAGRVEAARQPKTAFSVDLVQGIATLSIEGAPVRVMPLESVRRSRLLTVAHGTAPDMPEVVSLRSDIPHIPVRLVHAPKDTVEAQSRPPDRVPEPDEPSFAVISMDHMELRLTSGSWSFARFRDQLKERYARPAVVPWVTLSLPPSDIRAIYRSLEPGAPVAMRLR